MAEKTGHCACGAVTFTADVVGDHVGACHCETCRRLNAGPYLCVEGRNLTFAEGSPVAVYDSSEWADRPFCGTCGTSIAYRLKGTDSAWISAYVFDPPLGLPLTSEVFVDAKPGDYAFAGDTHKMTGEEVFAAFAGER
jgi:hypothetical protein